jgi:hypothetical protein
VKLELHHEAEQEITEAFAFYDRQRSGLGGEFLLALRQGFDRIEEAPQRWPRWDGTPPLGAPIQRFLVDRFPYAIGYQMYPERIVLLAVAHTSREPLYWLHRSS